jgi:hypothetical protein
MRYFPATTGSSLPRAKALKPLPPG